MPKSLFYVAILSCILQFALAAGGDKAGDQMSWTWNEGGGSKVATLRADVKHLQKLDDRAKRYVPEGRKYRDLDESYVPPKPNESDGGSSSGEEGISHARRGGGGGGKKGKTRQGGVVQSVNQKGEYRNSLLVDGMARLSLTSHRPGVRSSDVSSRVAGSQAHLAESSSPRQPRPSSQRAVQAFATHTSKQGLASSQAANPSSTSPLEKSGRLGVPMSKKFAWGQKAFKKQ